MTALLEHYRSQPTVTFDEHLGSLEDTLACEVLAKTRIYLDLRYWIFLRDANLDTSQRPVHRKLLDALVSGVEAGKVVCPITESVFFELERQGSGRTHILATAKEPRGGYSIRSAWLAQSAERS
jgi:hypothetical protein